VGVVMLALLAGCGSGTARVGEFTVATEPGGTLSIDHETLGPVIDGLRFVAGTGDAEVTMSFGAFRFDDVTSDLTGVGRLKAPRGRAGPTVIEADDADGNPLGLLVVALADDDALILDWSPSDFDANRLGFEAPCDADDHFLGLGAHAQDVDHVGEAFGLWVQEPGVGKTTDDEQPENWPVGGPKHATSLPVPFLVRPHRDQGLLVDTEGRVDVDLCATDPGTFSAVAWAEGTVRVVLFAGAEPLDPVRGLATYTGPYTLPQPWVFAPWNDAIRGSARVREVATTLRESGAPSSVIWTEDWKGASQTPFGYHLSGEWSVDEALYPDASTLAADLEADGFKWFAYFAPFLRSGTDAWDEALAADVTIHDSAGEPYIFTGFTFEDESMLDLSNPDAVAWAQERMGAAVDLGFDGWMADFAEWLPTDAVLANGTDAFEAHHVYPLAWQATSREALDGVDGTFFVRSGWTRTRAAVPVVWGGDQRTDFQPDDGMPTVVAMGLGLSASGVPVFTHDVAGYQSVGNPPSTKELFFRWAWLGAFTPILRTHHGAFDTDNWQFDSDADTVAHWAKVAREHMRLFPYRYGLAAKAARDGTPMILPPAFVYGGDDWGRTDAWMLGEALLVAPITTAGATSREVVLPPDVAWYDWFTHEPVQSGTFTAAVDAIPVFAAAGTTVPVFAQVPDTLVPTDGLVDLADADAGRVVYLFGGGGPFVEADGTTYAPSGSPSGAGEATQTVTSGTIEVAGVSLAITGTVPRAYTVVVIP